MKILKTSIKWKAHQLKEGKNQEGNDHRVLHNFPVSARNRGSLSLDRWRSGLGSNRVSVKRKNVR